MSRPRTPVPAAFFCCWSPWRPRLARAAHRRADREHDRGYRRWHHRGGDHLAGRYFRQHLGRVAGDDFDAAIINHVQKTYNMAIGEQTAEKIKIEIGSAAPFAEKEPSMEVSGAT